MNLLISIIDCKIAFLNRIRKYIVDSGLPKACVDEDAKKEDLKKWTKQNESNKRDKKTKR
tara:strand:+ start:340 stop:519 length:180 start_codon:yes stop_codon:yes gene_type:complete